MERETYSGGMLVGRVSGLLRHDKLWSLVFFRRSGKCLFTLLRLSRITPVYVVAIR